jgi:hypothetical protein
MKDRFGCDWSRTEGTRFWQRPQIGRRMFFRHAASAVGGYFLMPSRPLETVARAAPALKDTAKNCVFILMTGGPSHVDTFDLKEGSWTPPALAPTSYNGLRFPRGLLPTLAEQIDSLAFVRSMKAWANVHGLAQTWVQIGRNPTSGSSKIAPHIGSVVSLELSGRAGAAKGTLPAFVSFNAGFGVGAGYLPPEHAPFYSSPGGGGLANATHRDGAARFDSRYSLLLKMDAENRTSQDFGPAFPESAAYNAAARKLVYNSDVDKIFIFDQAERLRYGNSGFGSSCIAARNLLRAKVGTRFIQINVGNWDHHEDIYLPTGGHFNISRQFDLGLGTLIADLKSDGLLDETLIVAMGEFGRVPGPVNAGRGRDHYLNQAALFAGAGIRGGRAVGATDRDGRTVAETGWSRNREIRNEDVEATIYSALGIDYTTVRKDDPLGRGFEYVPSAGEIYGPIDELWS